VRLGEQTLPRAIATVCDRPGMINYGLFRTVATGASRMRTSFYPFLAVALLCLPAARPADATQPNFVWLLSEDNSKHFVRLFDEHGAKTPHIERLARHGLIFAHAFSNGPVCSVARTSLITGCYAPRIGTQYHRRAVTVPLPTGLRMFPAYLRAAGYYTTNRQKKDYNAVEGDGVWDESSRSASWRGRGPGQPFFHMQSFGTTHESSLHFSRQQMQQTGTETDPSTVFLPPHHPDTPLFRYTYARYHDRIRQLDQEIGGLVADLEDDGLLEDTFIFYFGDHGGVLPGSKGYACDRGLHVPLVVRVPDRWRHLVDADLGTRVRGFVSFVDFGPTLLHLAGVAVPPEMDGRPFLGAGCDLAEVNGRDEAFGYADRFDEKYDLVRTLRKGRFEYVRNYQPFNFDGLQNSYRYRMLAYRQWRDLFRAGQLSAVQAQFFQSRSAEALYDLQVDPYETNNLADDPAYREVRDQLRHRLAGWVKGLPDLSMFPESYLVEHAFADPVAFGKRSQDRISRLVDVADLSLIGLAAARQRLVEALRADDPWERYWALVVCSSYGEAARDLAGMARELAEDDPERLVRVRAAEFLGLTGTGDPRPILRRALAESSSGVEANLILNTVVLLRDGQPGYRFDVERADLQRLGEDSTGHVQRRLQYLRGSTP
jgi:arylsulfatase A-like enzyme